MVYGICALLAFIFVAVLTEWGFPMLDEHLRRIGDEAALRLLKTLGIVTAVVPLGFFVHFFRLGRRIQLSEQYPAPGARVIRDTVVIDGPAARRRGTFVIAVSVFGIVAVVLFVAILARF